MEVLTKYTTIYAKEIIFVVALHLLIRKNV